MKTYNKHTFKIVYGLNLEIKVQTELSVLRQLQRSP